MSRKKGRTIDEERKKHCLSAMSHSPVNVSPFCKSQREKPDCLNQNTVYCTRGNKHLALGNCNARCLVYPEGTVKRKLPRRAVGPLSKSQVRRSERGNVTHWQTGQHDLNPVHLEGERDRSPATNAARTENAELRVRSQL